MGLRRVDDRVPAAGRGSVGDAELVVRRQIERDALLDDTLALWGEPHGWELWCSHGRAGQDLLPSFRVVARDVAERRQPSGAVETLKAGGSNGDKQIHYFNFIHMQLNNRFEMLTNIIYAP